MLRRLLLAAYLLLIVYSLRGQDVFPPTGGTGTSVVGCVGTPGNTPGVYRQQCQTTAGALYTCNNAVGCTVAGDWIAVASGGGATIPNVTTVIAGSGTGNGVGTKVTLTPPTTAATVGFSADNESVLLPNGTVAANDLNNATTFVHDFLFTDATYDIGKAGATRPRDIFASRNAQFGGTLTIPAAGIFDASAATGSNIKLPNGILIGGFAMTFPGAAMIIPGLGQANTWSAGLQDFVATTMKIPASGGFVATVNSSLGRDTATSIVHVWAGTTDALIPYFPTATLPIVGHCVQWGANLTLVDATIVCGGGGGGNVSNSGTPTNGQIAQWINATTIQGITLIPIASGGTNASTQAGAATNVFPTATRAGDIVYWDGAIWNHLAGNNSGTNFLQENASGVPAWGAGSSSIAWSAISNPGGALSLVMGSNTSTFNTTTAVSHFFQFANTTAALVGASQSGPLLDLSCGTEWHASASTQGCATIQFVPGTGTDAANTIAITHSGSATGTTTTTFPGPVQAGAAGGVGGTISIPEGTAASGSSGVDVCYGDSTAHLVECSWNNASFVPVVLGATSTTTTQAFFATSTAGVGGYRAIATGDLPAIPLSGLATEAAGTVVGNATGSTAAPTATAAPVLGVDNTTAGIIQLANGSAAAHTTFASGATTSNTVAGPTVVVPNGHVVDCSTTSTTCTLHDSGVVTANVVNASSPGAGVAHFAGSTQTLTSSAVALADMASQSNATMVANVSGGSAAPTAVAIPTLARGIHTDANGTPGAATGHDPAATLVCPTTSASGTAEVCNTSPTFTPVAGDSIIFQADIANTGAFTLNVNSLGAKGVKKNGTTALVANDILASPFQVIMTYDGTNWEMQGQTGNAASGGGDTITSPNSTLAVGGTSTNTTLDVVSSVALAGSPTTTTQTAGDNTTKIATDAFVTTAVANAIAAVNPAVAVLAASTASLTGTYSNGASGIGATFTITATGAFTLDGIAINTIGQRVLLKDQSTAFQNGVYTATIVGTTGVSAVFTRALDYDQPSDINNTGAIPVQSGTVNTATSWLLTSTVNTVGTDALTYVKFSVNPANVLTYATPATGIARTTSGSQSVVSSELSGDVQTSGSNAATVIKVNGGSVPTSSGLVGTNSSGQLIAAPRVFGASFGSNAAGAAVLIADTVYFEMKYACSLVNWNIDVNPSGSVTFDVWQLATGGTALPTVTNTITASALPAISSAQGMSAPSTTFTGWATTHGGVVLAENDKIAIHLQGITSATFASIQFKCQ